MLRLIDGSLAETCFPAKQSWRFQQGSRTPEAFSTLWWSASCSAVLHMDFSHFTAPRMHDEETRDC